jgi:GxxExxY protein
MLYSDLTEKIIECAYKVYNTMGYGYLESVYEKCMTIELSRAGLAVEVQKPIRVFYEGHEVGNFVADMIVNDLVILELKSVTQIIRPHEVQLVNYLVATNRPVGLVINFGPGKVTIKRKLKQL